MTDPNHPKSGGGGPGKPASSPSDAASKDPAAQQGSSGRVVHDSRGNAVWQWVKDTGRQAIESTSALLKKLEVPELKVEDQKDKNELRLEDEVNPGGGYNPYGSTSGSRPSAPKNLPPIKK